MSAVEESVERADTPILDSGTLPAPIRSKVEIGGIIVGIVGWFIILKVINRQTAGSLNVYYGFLFLIPVLVVATAIHEFGHLLAGWAVGLRFSSVRVGPFSVAMEHGQIKIQMRRDLAVLGYAGMYVEDVRRLRRRLLIVTAAGPAANILTVAATAILLNDVFPSVGQTWVAVPAAELAVLSLLLAMGTLLPVSSGLLSDGSRIEMLLRSRSRARRWLSIAAIGGQMQRGINARDWKQTWLGAATSLRDMSLDEFAGNWLAYVSANELKCAPRAARHLERCLELAPTLSTSVRELLAQEAAVFCAWFREDEGLSDKWLRQVQKPQRIPPLLKVRIETALCCARRDFDGALSLWGKGASFIEELPPGPTQERSKNSWAEWGSEIQERKSRTPVM